MGNVAYVFNAWLPCHSIFKWQVNDDGFSKADLYGVPALLNTVGQSGTCGGLRVNFTKPEELLIFRNSFQVLRPLELWLLKAVHSFYAHTFVQWSDEKRVIRKKTTLMVVAI